MIYSHTQYNPDVHSSIVANYRRQWKMKTDRELTVTDTTIFETWRDTLGFEPDPAQGETEDSLVLDALADILDQLETGDKP